MESFAALARARLARLAGVLALAAVIGLIYRRAHPAMDRVPARGGQELNVLLTGAEPYYLQRDERWAGDTLGATAETMSAVGCLVSSVAMGSTALGIPVDPGELNSRLSAAGGYTPSALLLWAAVRRATGERVEAVVHPRPEHAILDEALGRKELPVIRFTLPNGAAHWVLVVGKAGDDYLVKDPLVTTRAIVKLSTRASWIDSVRVLKRAG